MTPGRCPGVIPAAPRSDRTVTRQHQNDDVHVFAAASGQTGQAVAMISPRIDTGMMNLPLQRFSQSLLPDVHAVMILDQAVWHVSQELVTPANVSGSGASAMPPPAA